MKIQNCIAYQNGRLQKGAEIYTQGAYITEKTGDGEILDAEGCYVIPGLIDIHFHGCDGVDFCDGTQEAIQKMAEYELRNGVTSMHPATMTLAEDTLLQISKEADKFHTRQQQNPNWKQEAELIGIYMEGPFISIEKKGAQNPLYVHKPDADILRRLQQASGNLYRICALAPEVDGAMTFLQEMKDEIRITVAHTVADYNQASEAFSCGARQVTHLYNAMSPFSHRAPGVIGAACDADQVAVELICDGVHSHPATIRTTFKMFGADRIIMISDSMMATGMPDGIYALGGQDVEVHGNLATLTVDGAIAGSATNLFDCMRYMVEQVGMPLETVLQCVSENPAKAIGVFEKYGSIANGKYADLVIMDHKLQIKHVIKHGVLAF